jgi:hypothetical protein
MKAQRNITGRCSYGLCKEDNHILNLKKMETIYTLKDIEPTSYKSWVDFYFKNKSHSEKNGIYSYEYFAASGEVGEIELKISWNIVRGLCLEEARILLPQLNVSSFAELFEKHKDKISDNRRFEFNVMVKAKNDEVFFKKIVFEIDHSLNYAGLKNLNRIIRSTSNPKFNCVFQMLLAVLLIFRIRL